MASQARKVVAKAREAAEREAAYMVMAARGAEVEAW